MTTVVKVAVTTRRSWILAGHLDEHVLAVTRPTQPAAILDAIVALAQLGGVDLQKEIDQRGQVARQLITALCTGTYDRPTEAADAPEPAP